MSEFVVFEAAEDNDDVTLENITRYYGSDCIVSLPLGQQSYCNRKKERQNS